MNENARFSLVIGDICHYFFIAAYTPTRLAGNCDDN